MSNTDQNTPRNSPDAAVGGTRKPVLPTSPINWKRQAATAGEQAPGRAPSGESGAAPSKVSSAQTRPKVAPGANRTGVLPTRPINPNRLGATGSGGGATPTPERVRPVEGKAPSVGPTAAAQDVAGVSAPVVKEATKEERAKPKKPRKRRVTPLNEELLQFLALTPARVEHLREAVEGVPNRHGVDTRPVVSVYNLMYKLRNMGLVTTKSDNEQLTYMLTRKGWRHLGQKPRAGRYNSEKEHTLALARLYGEWTRDRMPFISDLEMEVAQKSGDAKNGETTVVSMTYLRNDPDYGRYMSKDLMDLHVDAFNFSADDAFKFGIKSTKTHRPDAVACLDDAEGIGLTAVEVELSHKSTNEMLWIMSGYFQALSEERFYDVRYYCTHKVAKRIKRLVESNWDRFNPNHREQFRKIKFLRYYPEVWHSDM